MSVWLWVLIGLMVVMLIGNFMICCSDLLPWNRRKKK